VYLFELVVGCVSDGCEVKIASNPATAGSPGILANPNAKFYDEIAAVVGEIFNYPSESRRSR
jgi:hypothetical protein